MSYDEVLQSKIREMMVKEFGTENIDKNMETIKLCLQYRQYLSVFQMQFDGEDLDIAILRALLSGKDQGNMYYIYTMLLVFNSLLGDYFIHSLFSGYA